MKTFIVIYHAPADLMRQNEVASPEEMKKGMEPWMVWAEKCGEQLLDMGNPLMGGIKLNQDGSSVPSDKDVVGYSILKAESMDEAKSLMDEHPHLKWAEGCEIEVHEAMPLPA